MAYTAPVIEDIKIKGRATHLCNELLAWESKQLPGFLSLRAKTKDGADATRFIALDAIEEITIANEELYKASPSCFVPETRLKATVEKC